MVRIGWLMGLITVAILTISLSPASGERARGEGEAAASTHSTSTQPLGSVGCSATSCHGSLDSIALTEPPTDKCWKSSATIWHALDPHRKAYDALTSKLGLQIGRLMKIDAATDARCLACHVNPAAVSHTKLHREGVSCEACHGNAASWYEPHTAWPAGKRVDSMASVQMPNLNDHAVQARTCAGCHIGDGSQSGLPVRDMNHDMIAAGHPRLDAFNFEELRKKLPPHWLERDRGLKQSPNAGDGAALTARMLLSKDRAARHSPWPEFAEQKCESCHRNLIR